MNDAAPAELVAAFKGRSDALERIGAGGMGGARAHRLEGGQGALAESYSGSAWIE